MTDHAKLICKALADARYCSPETAAKNVIAALAAEGLVIQSADEAAARVAAAERKGMDRAAEIAANFDEKDCYGRCADAIRAEMEADDG